jgi:kynurenine formamidase
MARRSRWQEAALSAPAIFIRTMVAATPRRPRQIIMLMLLVAGAGASPAGLKSPNQSTKPRVTKAEYYRWLQESSNWHRWGKDDELGTLNLITPAKRKQAAALVKDGVTVSLAALQVPNGLDPQDPNSAPPYRATWTFKEGWEQSAANDPWNSAPPEGLSLPAHDSRSHIDALAHNFRHGRFYNGFPWTVMTKNGTQKLGIQNLRHGIVTRGILIDIPKLKGVPFLQASEHIYVEDLEAWEKKAGVRVSPGDALFIRAGNWARRRATREQTPSNSTTAGLDPSVARWLRERDVAVIGSEGAIDALPSGYTGQGDDMPTHPVHYFVNVMLGMTILDWLDFDALGDAAARMNRWEFMLMAAPLPIQGGTGSPINPIGVF